MAFRLTQGFSRLHNGVDLAAPRGTPVYAVAGGSVVFAGWGGAIPGIARQSGGGNVVEIEAAGRVYQYAHLDSIAMRVGSQVSSGALVGTVGNTGYSFGNHLQFAVWQRSVGWLNPLQLYTLATLIALLSGSSSPAGAPVGQTTAAIDPTTLAKRQAVLERLGITTAPDHRFSPAEAERLADEYGVTRGSSVWQSIVSKLTGMTVGEWLNATGPINTSGDPFTWVGELVAGLQGIVGRAGQAAILAGLLLLGVYFLLRPGR